MTLPDALDRLIPDLEILGIDLARWLLAGGILLGTYGVLSLARSLLVRRLRHLTERTENVVDDLLLDLARRAHTLFLLAVGAYLAALSLELSPARDQTLMRVFSLILFLQGGIWGSRLVRFLIDRTLSRQEPGAEAGPRASVLHLFGVFGQLAVWSLVVLLGLSNLGYDVTALVTGLGIGGVAVALALQSILSDTFASLSIILDKPFEVGDSIRVDDFAGTVERIGLKTTRLRALSGEQLVLGNHDLLSTRIRNFKRMQERRAVFSFGLVYQTPVDRLPRVVEEVRRIIESIEQTRFERAHFTELGESALTFEVVYDVLVPDYGLYLDIQQEINLRLMRFCASEGLDFAYPTRTLWVQPPTLRVEGGEKPPSGPGTSDGIFPR